MLKDDNRIRKMLSTEPQKPKIIEIQSINRLSSIDAKTPFEKKNSYFAVATPRNQPKQPSFILENDGEESKSNSPRDNRMNSLKTKRSSTDLKKLLSENYKSKSRDQSETPRIGHHKKDFSIRVNGADREKTLNYSKSPKGFSLEKRKREFLRTQKIEQSERSLPQRFQKNKTKFSAKRGSQLSSLNRNKEKEDSKIENSEASELSFILKFPRAQEVTSETFFPKKMSLASPNFYDQSKTSNFGLLIGNRTSFLAQ